MDGKEEYKRDIEPHYRVQEEKEKFTFQVAACDDVHSYHVHSCVLNVTNALAVIAESNRHAVAEGMRVHNAPDDPCENVSRLGYTVERPPVYSDCNALH
jgi:hypothetical protein